MHCGGTIALAGKFESSKSPNSNGAPKLMKIDNKKMRKVTCMIMYRVRDFAEERSRTLYVRLPHRIRNPKEVQELFENDARVKLPRQASRACHVIFPNVEEKIKGLKNLKDKTIDGKRIIALNPRTKPQENRIKPKKIVVPKPKQEPKIKITQSLFVANITKKTTIADLKKAFPGSTSVTMLDVNSKGLRSAFVKMESVQIAGEYMRKEREIPLVNGNRLSINIDTRIPRKRRSVKTEKLKIYDEDGKSTKNKFENLKNKKSVKKIEIVEGSENSGNENESENDSDNDNETE